MTFFLIASITSYWEPVVPATLHRTRTSAENFLISFHLCSSFCRFPRRRQEQLIAMLLTKQGVTRRGRDKAIKATAAKEGRMCFTGGSEHQESTVVGCEAAHSRKGPDKTPTILFTFSPTTKIAQGRNYLLHRLMAC